MRFLLGIIDRLLFVAVFILAMQVPQFISLYQQRVEGYLQSNQSVLDKFSTIAHNQNLASLDKLVIQLQNSKGSASKQTAQFIQTTQKETQELAISVQSLDSPSLGKQLWALIRYPQPKLLLSTLDHYQPGIIINQSALMCGIIFAIIFMFVKASIAKLFRRRRRLFRASDNPLR
ncbi:DUF2937 family protein [Celerinatantimonas diazotrophica]|uniref:DUF2937 family protein n=1 Tax=Celerinatantimonas diazotrophica TaxID=412034 RepID=A0A4R1J8S1_9GAMM|nr:DUF2937 family protein [Celerinatantimonas diazotrophica]TCK46956.1 DUF2937 family protein [Celerinatantimonas diazotrophica]CAG9295724.1 hypothetical protein CEDIAZO_00850 [Celerinatantimonas diazotrophica]